MSAFAPRVDARPLQALRARHLEAASAKLRATRLFEMIEDRGYSGLRLSSSAAYVRAVRPEGRTRRSFASRRCPASRPRSTGAAFGRSASARAKRALSCFVLVLSLSRGIFARFTLDQTLESFVAVSRRSPSTRFGGVPRSILYDNLEDRRPRAAWRPDSIPSAPPRSRRPLPLRAQAVRAVPRQ